MKRYALYYPLLLLAVMLAWFIFKATSAPFSDYAGYYFGSRALLRGNYETVYDTWSLNQLIAQQGYSGIFVSYTPFPPFTSIVLAPFLLFPVAVSKILFNVFSAVMFIWVLARAGKYLSLPPWVLWLMPVIFFIPLHNNIFFGQAYLLLFALLLEGYIAYKKGKPVIAALLWGVAIVFKLFPLVILFFLLAKKQYKQVVYCLAVCALLGSISVLLNGFAAWQYYVFTIFPRANNGELNDSYTYLFQSAFMLLKNLFVYDAVQNPQVVLSSMPVFVICMVLFKALLLACCVGITIHKKATDFVAFAGWITASLLLSPNGSSYSLILLLMPLLALARSKPVYLVTVMALLVLVCFIPVSALGGKPLLLQFPRLYGLLLLFGVLMVAAGMQFSVKLFAALVAVLLLADAGKLFPKPDKSTYLLLQPLPFVYEYAIKENQLVYRYWDGSGSHETSTHYGVHNYSTSDVRIQNNQVYYKNKQLTSTPDLKKQPMLVNGTQIIYLSDRNRGFGFYTLRTITNL
ncbi:glycosyltransferase family 87 protein [Niastella yeongjuensis]|uniref:glycosyltransferase family 87 protein n=1 Tax=Niastella yeongjuensis TaxID=354355 RepID=UPI0010541D2E|nr:glycosyltransferase family 87 protein [Niastella yeongjuensis]